MKVLVTGAAGFIANALIHRLLERGDEVIGLDNINDYYDINLKLSRLASIKNHQLYTDLRVNLHDREAMNAVFEKYKPQRVVNLAAQAGVRYSIENPYAYIDSNINGFINVLEGCRHHDVEHLVYASSSSVYGANSKMPFSTQDSVNHPVSLYAATKKSNELMAHTYSHLYELPTTGLRFFTVYGPWGRPDMAYFSFTKAILAGKTIDIYNHGKMQRDFTYITDIVEGVIRVLDKIPSANPLWRSDLPDPASSNAPYKLYNIGNNNPVSLMHMIDTLEKNIGVEANKNYMSMQAGDVLATYADIDDLAKDIDFKPKVCIEEGLERFVSWYKQYYDVRQDV